MTNENSDTVLVLIERAKNLFEWARELSTVLNQIKDDHLLLDSHPEFRLYFAVDYHDIHAFVFQDFEDNSWFNRPNRLDYIRAQIGRITLFYGLPKRYYPLLLLDPHYYELREFTILKKMYLKPRTHHELISALKEQMPELDSLILKTNKLGKRGKQVDLQKNQQENLINALIAIAPDLLYAISGLYHQSMEVMYNLFKQGRISADCFRWNFENLSAQEKIDLSRLNSSLKCSEQWLNNFNEERSEPHLALVNRRDATALTIIHRINQLLKNKPGIVCLVSSAKATKNVIQKAGEMTVCRMKLNASEQEVPIFRTIDLFRHYNRFRLCTGNPLEPNNSQILELVEKELLELKPLIDPQIASSFDEIIKVSNSNLTVQSEKDIDFVNRYAKSMNFLKEFIQKAEALKSHLQKAMDMANSSTFIGAYHKIDSAIPAEYSKDQNEQDKELLAVIEKIIRLLQNPDEYFDFLWEVTFRQRISLFNQLFLLAGTPQLISPERLGADDIFNFQPFPYSLNFRNKELKKDILNLNKTMNNPNIEINEGDVRIQLMDIAEKISGNTYWGGTTADCTEFNFEKYLIIMAILYALRMHKLIIEAIEIIVWPNGNNIKQNTDDFQAWKDDFSLIKIISEWALFIGKRDKACWLNLKKEMTERNIIPEVISHTPQILEQIEPRILHILSYIAGYGMRTNSATSEFNFDNIIKLRAIVIKRLREVYPNNKLLITLAYSSLAYSMSLSGEETYIRDSLNIINSIPIPENKLFRDCLHAKGFVFMRNGLISNDFASKVKLFEEARRIFNLATNAREYGLPAIGVNDRLTKDQKFTEMHLASLNASN